MFGEARQAGTLAPLRSHPSRRLASVPDFTPHPAREHFQLLLATAQAQLPWTTLPWKPSEWWNQTTWVRRSLHCRLARSEHPGI